MIQNANNAQFIRQQFIEKLRLNFTLVSYFSRQEASTCILNQVNKTVTFTRKRDVLKITFIGFLDLLSTTSKCNYDFVAWDFNHAFCKMSFAEARSFSFGLSIISNKCIASLCRPFLRRRRKCVGYLCICLSIFFWSSLSNGYLRLWSIVKKVTPILQMSENV